ncbi:MAG: phage tail tape measure protein [Balneola sp.]
MANRRVTYYVDVDSSGAVTGWKKAEEGLDDLDGKLPKVKKGLLSLDNVGRLAAAGGIGLVLQKGLARSIEKGKEFENKLADLEAITGITGDRLQRLGSRSLDLSKIYGTSAANIIEANKLVASQLAQKIDFGTEEGFQELQKVSEEAIVLSKATGANLNDSVATVTSTINQFNLRASESNRIINTLAAGSKFGAAEVPAIGAALVNAGSAAAGANASIEETNALIQVLAANGQVGERAGTALRAIFLRLQTAGEDLAEYGLGNVDIKANGVNATLKQLTPILDDATAMKKIFGEEAFNAASILIREADAVADMTEKVTGSNIAYQQAETRMNTFEGATDRLQATIDGALIPAFQESNGVMVVLINNVASLIEQFAGGIAVINQWMDTHSDLRRELNLGTSSTDSQIRSMQALREELAKAALDGKLTAAQEKELRIAYESTTESLKNRASGLFDSTFALKQQRDAIQENIDRLKDSESSKFGGDAIALKRYTAELEALNLEITSNEARFKKYMDAIEDGSMTFDEFIKKVKEAREAQSGDGGSDSTTQINDLRTLAGLQKELAEEKKAFGAATDQQARDSHNARMVELQEQIQAIESRYSKEKIDLSSIAGVKAKISEEEQAYLAATTDAEREKHAQAMTELQEILTGLDIKSSKEKHALDSLASIQDQIREKEKSYLSAASDQERARLKEELDQLRIIQAAKLESLSVEEVVRKQNHEAKMADLQEFFQYVNDAASTSADFFSTIIDRRIDGLEKEKEQKLENINTELQAENLSEERRKTLIKQRQEIEEKYNKEIASQKKKQFNLDKAANAIRAAIQTALAVVEALPNIPLSIVVGGLGAVQVASILAQPNPYKDGGPVFGNRHSQGGTLIEAEHGEYVINRESTRRSLPLIKRINEDPDFAQRLLSGIPFAERGGMIPSPNINIDVPIPGNAGIDSNAISAAVGSAISEAMKDVKLYPKITYSEILEAQRNYDQNREAVGNQS